MTNAHSHDELARQAARELVVVTSRLRRRLRELRAGEGPTPSQTSVLSRIEKGGPATASELAVAERVRPQSMAATVAALVEAGLVQRESDPDDGRRQLVTLTESARAWISTNRRARDEWLGEALGATLDAEELQRVVDAMALVERAVLG